MASVHPARIAHQRKHMRCNAHLAIRHDAYRFMPPGSPRYVGKDVVKYFWGDPAGDPPEQQFDCEYERDLAAERAALLHLKSELAAIKAELKFRRLLRSIKAYNPNQPRVPAGNPDGGEWTNGDGSTREARVRLAGDPPINDPPEIPKEKPTVAKERAQVLRETGKRLAKILRAGARIDTYIRVLEGISWVRDQIPNIVAYTDPPKSLEELQQAVSKTTTPGYQDHHIIEQGSARDEYEKSIINLPEHIVRIPTLKHRQINGWYQTPKKEFEGLSPREWLRGKPWDVRRRVGLDALMEHEVLKP